MRLICPNCATQYEVDDSAVPAAGREVQCGSCASTWFQAPARSNVAAHTEKRSDLPEWVEDIVEDDALEEAPELPGTSPEIVSAPNEDIVSEPELDGLIDTGDLPANIDTGHGSGNLSLHRDADPTQRSGSTAAADITPSDVVTETAQAGMTATDLRDSPAAATSHAKVPEEDDIKAAELAKTASQAAVAAAIAANVAGRPAEAKTPPSAKEASETPAPQERPEMGVAEEVDVSTELETAIRERTSATKEDFPAIAAAELEASRSLEDEAKAAADAAIKAAEQAAALEVAEKAAAQHIEATIENSVQQSNAADARTTDVTSDIAPSEPTPVAEAQSQDVSEALSEVAPSSDEPSAVPIEVADATVSAPDDQVDPDTTDAIAAEIKSALEDLEAGKPIPQNVSEEKLSDYDLTEPHDIPEEFAAVLPDEASGPIKGPTEAFDPDDISVDKPDMSMPVTAAVSPSAASTAPVSKAEQTETLAAKLKARVAEAAKAQETAAVGTAGVVVGASAAGIAAAGGRRRTAFPKRDTEELASSLRPKSTDGGGIKPRLRPPATPEPTKSRFGQGFLLAIAIFAVALLVYLFRVQIGTAIPALEPMLTSYAGAIDNVRLIFQDAIGKLTGSVAGDGQS